MITTEIKKELFASNIKVIEEIVKKNPKTDAELKKIIGIGEAKLKDFGKDIIKMVNSSI